MTKRQIQDYLQDILDAVAAIEQFKTGISKDDFANSWVFNNFGDVFEFEYGKALRRSNRAETGQSQ